MSLPLRDSRAAATSAALVRSCCCSNAATAGHRSEGKPLSVPAARGIGRSASSLGCVDVGFAQAYDSLVVDPRAKIAAAGSAVSGSYRLAGTGRAPAEDERRACWRRSLTQSRFGDARWSRQAGGALRWAPGAARWRFGWPSGSVQTVAGRSDRHRRPLPATARSSQPRDRPAQHPERLARPLGRRVHLTWSAPG